jgi:hypothetical protein
LYARGFLGRLPVPPGVPAWFPTPIVRPGLFIVLIAIGLATTSAAIFATWNRWTRTEQRALVAGAAPRSALNPITSMVAIVWTLLVASVVLLRPVTGVKLDAGLLWLFASFGFFIFGLAILSAFVLLKIVPAPEVEGHRAAESQHVGA